jgi:hypothetical protein
LQNKANASAASNLANGYGTIGAINSGLSGIFGGLNASGVFGGGSGGGLASPSTWANPYPTSTVGGGTLWGVGAPIQTV